eukprot:scaffold11064_cov30-Tisochrysis_lutea.AAC.1
MHFSVFCFSAAISYGGGEGEGVCECGVCSVHSARPTWPILQGGRPSQIAQRGVRTSNPSAPCTVPLPNMTIPREAARGI